jgi:hypothetical protein
MGAPGATLARSGIALALGLSLVVGLGGRYAAVAGDGQGESTDTLSGTWKTTVTIINCQTGLPLPIPQNPFPALHTFEENGTLLDSSSRYFRSSGHGSWERTGPHEFLARVIFFRFAPDGTYLGTLEGTRRIRLTSPNTYTAEGTAEQRDASGNLVLTACDRATGTRF